MKKLILAGVAALAFGATAHAEGELVIASNASDPTPMAALAEIVEMFEMQNKLRRKDREKIVEPQLYSCVCSILSANDSRSFNSERATMASRKPCSRTNSAL